MKGSPEGTRKAMEEKRDGHLQKDDANQLDGTQKNDSVLGELMPTCFLAEVKRRKLRYFGLVVRADNLCTHVHTCRRGLHKFVRNYRPSAT